MGKFLIMFLYLIKSMSINEKKRLLSDSVNVLVLLVIVLLNPEVFQLSRPGIEGGLNLMFIYL